MELKDRKCENCYFGKPSETATEEPGIRCMCSGTRWDFRATDDWCDYHQTTTEHEVTRDIAYANQEDKAAVLVQEIEAKQLWIEHLKDRKAYDEAFEIRHKKFLEESEKQTRILERIAAVLDRGIRTIN